MLSSKLSKIKVNKKELLTILYSKLVNNNINNNKLILVKKNNILLMKEFYDSIFYIKKNLLKIKRYTKFYKEINNIIKEYKSFYIFYKGLKNSKIHKVFDNVYNFFIESEKNIIIQLLDIDSYNNNNNIMTKAYNDQCKILILLEDINVDINIKILIFLNEYKYINFYNIFSIIKIFNTNLNEIIHTDQIINNFINNIIKIKDNYIEQQNLVHIIENNIENNIDSTKKIICNIDSISNDLIINAIYLSYNDNLQKTMLNINLIDGNYKYIIGLCDRQLIQINLSYLYYDDDKFCIKKNIKNIKNILYKCSISYHDNKIIDIDILHNNDTLKTFNNDELNLIITSINSLLNLYNEFNKNITTLRKIKCKLSNILDIELITILNIDLLNIYNNIQLINIINE